MDRVVETITPKKLPTMQIKRVCAYARVSYDKDTMIHSLSAQISYYQDYIQSHPGWQFCGVYADEPISGTKEMRKQFCAMVEECKKGNIDLIVTKAISRFARNTVVLLETCRELKAMGVEVYFEEQDISTFTTEGELMLTILAAFAQEESLSNSENMKWRIKKCFEEGKPWSGHIYGYRLINRRFEIIPEEAAVIHKIVQCFFEGHGYVKIAKMLNAEGIPSSGGGLWNHAGVSGILKQYNYTGNLLLQTSFTSDYLTKKWNRNRGEYPMYHAEGTHEAIIPLETFKAIQEETERRKKKYLKNYNPEKGEIYPFTGMIRCPCCGVHYRRKKTYYTVAWVCSISSQKGKEACPQTQTIPEDILTAVTCDVVGIEHLNNTVLKETIEKIIPIANNTLLFKMKDGTEITRHWEFHSRKSTWTEEKRKEFGELMKEKKRCRK